MRKVVFLLGAILWCTVASAAAEQSARDALQGMLDRLHSNGLPSVVEMVDWEEAYAQIDKKARNTLSLFSINSPQEFRSGADKFLRSPELFVRSTVAKMTPGMAPEAQLVMQQIVMTQLESALTQYQKAKEQVARAKYRIEEVNEQDSQAAARVWVSMDGKEDRPEVTLHKKNGHWFITGIHSGKAAKQRATQNS